MAWPPGAALKGFAGEHWGPKHLTVGGTALENMEDDSGYLR